MTYIEYAIIVFQVLISTGGAARIGYIVFQASMDSGSGEEKSHKKRIINTLIFMVAANGAIIIRNIIVGYLS